MKKQFLLSLSSLSIRALFLSLEGDQQKKEKERNRSSSYVRTRTLDHVLFFFWIAKRKKDDRGIKMSSYGRAETLSNAQSMRF